MTRAMLMLLFAGILVAMAALTVWASLERSVFAVDLASNRWFQATLADAYFGFITFYVWVAYRESRVWARVIWFLLIMGLGNMAMAAYMLIRLARWDPSGGPQALLLRQDALE